MITRIIIPHAKQGIGFPLSIFDVIVCMLYRVPISIKGAISIIINDFMSVSLILSSCPVAGPDPASASL